MSFHNQVTSNVGDRAVTPPDMGLESFFAKRPPAVGDPLDKEVGGSLDKEFGSSRRDSTSSSDNEESRATISRDIKQSEVDDPIQAVSVEDRAAETTATQAVGAIPVAEVLEKREELVRTTSGGTASSEGRPGEDDESKYTGGFPLFLLTLGLTMSVFCIALDNTILATAIPRITTEFSSLGDVGWYGSSYLLTTTSLQPSFGKIYSFFNIKWTYIIALVIFELGSVICGAAVDSRMLIVGRAIAGVGAAALFSGAMTIIGYAVPLRKRPLFIGLLSSMFGISSIIGPILGGAFTDRVSWRWCFYINLPLGGVAIVVVFIFFHNPIRKETKMSFKEKIQSIDLVGAFVLICAIVCLLLALQWGGTTYAWSDSKVWGCILGAGLLIGCFIGLQFYLGDKATIPPRILLKQRTVLACALFSSLLAMALYTHIYYLPFYFQAVRGTSAEQSGIRTIPYLISNTLSSLAVGGAITALGPYVPFTWIGSAVFAIGAGLLYTLGVDTGPGKWIGYQILAGIGAGACVQIPFIAVQVVLPKKDLAVGNAIAIFFNTLGGALSISIAQNIFSNTLLKQLHRLAPEVDALDIVAAGATHVREITPTASLAGVLEAYDIAITDAFILGIATAGLAFLVSFMFEWKSVKGKKIEAAGA